jgi:hypothetical protein
MKAHRIRSVARWLTGGVGLIVGAYAAYVGVAWYRYGRPRAANADERDELLDRFMPVYEVVERHNVRVAAPAAVTLSAACDLRLSETAVARTIFKGRELILRAKPDDPPLPTGLLSQMQALGWGVLAEAPDREIVVGAVTKPWEANVTFRPLPPADFAAFHDPGYVKIAWTIRADPVSATESRFRTETRAIATDPISRAKFRRYWSLFSPGIIVIRWAMLGPVKSEAERRVTKTTSVPGSFAAS